MASVGVNFQTFWAAHEPQLKAIKFPQNLAEDLFTRLQEEANLKSVSGVDFQVQKFKNSRPMLISKKDITKFQHFYIIEHIWTSDGNVKGYKELEKSPDLAEKLAITFGLAPYSDPDLSTDFTDQHGILKELTKLPDATIAQVLAKHEGDTISSAMELIDVKSEDVNIQDTDNVKRKEPKCTYEEFVEALKAAGNAPDDADDEYLKKMYEHFLKDGEGSGTTLRYNWSDDGDIVTVNVSIPRTAKKQTIKSTLSTHHWKLVVLGQELISGPLHGSVKAEDSYWSIESPGVLCMTLEKVEQNAWGELIKGEERLSSNNIISNFWVQKTTKRIYLDSLLDAMWKFNQTYTITSPDRTRKEPAWYIMDEYGSSLIHSDDPNMKCSPFFNVLNGKTYSLLWPIKDIKKNEACTRNYIPQIIANETVDVCKVRLKAFFDKKDTEKTNFSAAEENKEDLHEYVKTKLKKRPQVDYPKIKIFVDSYQLDSVKEKLSTLKIDITTDKNLPADCNLLNMCDMSINIEGDILPVGEMILNKDYFNNYLTYSFPSASWLNDLFILPRDLVDFDNVFGKVNVPQYWIVKPVDRRNVYQDGVVSCDYSRIVRLSEAGSIAVSKYFVDQPSFRNRRFTLSYSIGITSARNVFILAQPFIRLCKNEYEPNAFIDEYDTSSSVTLSPENENMRQDKDTFDDFKVVMNKLLLPRDADKGWKYTEEIIFQRIGTLMKKFANDLCFDSSRKTIVLCSVDVILNDAIHPCIIDVNVKANLPNLQSILEFLKLGQDFKNQENSFVEVL